MGGTIQADGPEPRSGNARPGGFTILELLISLALVAALSAMVGVALVERLREGTREETLGQVRGVIALVREEARRLGEPIRLIGEEDGTGVWRLVALPWDLSEDDVFEEGGGERAIGEIDVSRIAFDESANDGAEGARREGSGRVYLVLARGYRIERLGDDELERERASLAEGSGLVFDGAMSGRGERSGEEGGRGRVTIGLFLPDGSVVAGDAPFVRTAGGDLYSIEINPWTGSAELVDVSEVAPDSVEGEEVESEEDGTKEDVTEEEPRGELGEIGELDDEDMSHDDLPDGGGS